MINKVLISLILVLSIQTLGVAQQETYTITKAPFSSDKYDEYSPVFYKNGIVFCTNRDGSLSNYSTSENKRLFKINYVDTTGNVNWKSSVLFSKDLKTKMNDGPVTFNVAGDTIYYSRNLEVDNKSGSLSSARNKLGIFSAIFDGEGWTRIRELRFNNEWYNISTPWLTPDGKRLYFASDMPDGIGGSDLYYCQWKGDYWDNPVNLGPVINTKGNEAYPFINPAGELFFASDGHQGLGGKDIFFSRMSGNEWLTPVRLDAPINSQYDDFGIITDSLIAEGYFSSNRDKTLDIFHFTTNFPQIFYTTAQKENKYCFRLSDSGAIIIDTLRLKYLWDFGDGKKAFGAVVSHCFPGPGKYNVKLDIVDRSTGDLFFSKLSYELDLRDFEQPYINAPAVAVKEDMIDFDGLKSNLPGYEIYEFVWDFGDGTRERGESVRHSFNEAGEYQVNLGVTLKSDSSGNIHNTGVTRKISVYDNQQELGSALKAQASVKVEIPDIRKYEKAYIKPLYSAESAYKQVGLFQIELVSSKTKIGLTSNIFRTVPSKYTVKEEYEYDSGTFYYFVADEHMTLMATYPTFKEITAAGFKGVQTKLRIIEDPVKQELYKIMKNFGNLSDTYFDNYNRLTGNGYLLLDQIVILMNRNPEVRLEVGIHTDNTGSAATNLRLSQTRAQVMVSYLINRGINSTRLVAKGYGEAKPVASNMLDSERRLNRRIDLKLIE